MFRRQRLRVASSYPRSIILAFMTTMIALTLTASSSRSRFMVRAFSAMSPLPLKSGNGDGNTIGGGIRDYSASSSSSISATPAAAGSQPQQQRILEPLVVCGPSGVGKGTIISKYMTEYGGSNHFGFTVSHTTRFPREGEVDGVHYHFVSKEEMQRDISNGEFLEHANVHGNLYGTSFSSIFHVEQQQLQQQSLLVQKKTIMTTTTSASSGDDDEKEDNDGAKTTRRLRALLDIDVQGVRNMKEQESPVFKPRYIFIGPPSLEVLRERLLQRGSESSESLATRTKNAEAEVQYGMTKGNFDVVVVNNDLERACRDFDRAIKSLYSDLS